MMQKYSEKINLVGRRIPDKVDERDISRTRFRSGFFGYPSLVSARVTDMLFVHDLSGQIEQESIAEQSL